MALPEHINSFIFKLPSYYVLLLYPGICVSLVVMLLSAHDIPNG